MSVHVSCPGCGTRLKAPEDRIGKKARCNKCNTSFRVPRPSDPASTPQPAAPPPADDDDIPMASPADDLETPPPGATPNLPSALPPAKSAFGSAGKLPAVTPTPRDPSAKAKPKPPAGKPTSPPPPPPKAEPEVFSLDDAGPPREPITTADNSTPTVSDASAIPADPFAFDLGTAAPAPKEEPKPKRRRDRDEEEEEPRPRRRDRDEKADRKRENDATGDEEEPARPRYVRPGEQASGKQTLILASVLGLLALGALVAAVVMMTRKPEPPATAKKDDKKEEPPPAATPDKGVGSAEPPAKKDPVEPTKKDATSPPPKKDAKTDAVPPAPPVTMLELPRTLRTFQFRKPSEKPELAETPSGSAVAVEVPFEKVARVFAPQNRTTQDVVAVWVSNPGFNGKGQQLSVDSYSATTGKRVGRFEFDGDGGAAKCDVSNDATLFVAAGPDGKLSVWDVAKKEKTLDGFDPYADKPQDKKAGLAAVFFAKTPLHLVTVSTAGVVHLHEILTKKTLATFTPVGPLTPNRVAEGRGVAASDDRSTLVLAAGGTVYQIATIPPLEVVWKHDLGGEVGRSLGVGVAGNPGRVTYAFETDSGKGKKERAVMFCLPRGTPEFYRWPDAAGEPTGVAWAGTDIGVIATTRGAVWSEYDSEAKRFLVLALAEVPGGKAIHAATERSHWYLVPNPADAKGSLFVELAMPPDGLIDYRNAAEARQPVHVVKLDAMGLWR